MEPPTPGSDASVDVPTASSPAPPVVAVVVAHDPGIWFEKALAAVAALEYPDLSILVIDADSAEELRPRVAAVAPGAFVRRLDANAGFGTSVNEVLDVVDGAAFFLICHDDAAPDPDVLRLLVEEAYRSNAAVVGPKLVAWDEPRRLLQVGETVDHAGFTVPLVERGELDQGQHDAVREVFSVPGACTLVRADLFKAVGGFDEGIDYLLDDLSLCWRAHVAGARVVVAPEARVRHVEALAARRPGDDRRKLQARHRLRILLSCTSALGLLVAVPKTLVVNAVEILYSLLVGRAGQARDVAGAWTWNLRRLGEIRVARRQVRGFRQVPDRQVRRGMARGSARVNQFVRGQIGSADRWGGVGRTGRDLTGSLRSRPLRVSAGVWVAVLLVLVAGSRHLLTRGIPSIGELVAFSLGPFDLLRTWAAGWRPVGLGSATPAPSALGALGVAGLSVVGAMGLLRTLVTLALIPLGVLGVYRLARPFGSRYGQLAAMVLYAANPVPYNALAQGRWSGLVAYATVPFVVTSLARGGGLAPFAPHRPGRRGALTAVVGLGVVVALAAMLAPSILPLTAVVAVAMVVGSLLTYSLRGSARILAMALAGLATAIVLGLPAMAGLVDGTDTWAGVLGRPTAVEPVDLADVLRFATGPHGESMLGWAPLVAAGLALFVGRGDRHAWAVRGWTLAVTSWGLVWAAGRGEIPIDVPPAEVLLVPGAVGLAIGAATGVAAFEVDLPGYRFGWRQIASGLAALALAMAVVPVLGAAFDGRWSMPAGDHARALGFVDDEAATTPLRVLWLGHPDALPISGWSLDDDLAYATTDEGLPTLAESWPGAESTTTRRLADAVGLARSGQTARLGRLLAPMGVRYVVVAERLAPDPFATDDLPIPADLRPTLAAQLDLEPVDVPAGLSVFRNQAFAPTRAALDEPPPEGGSVEDAAAVDLSGAAPVLPDATGQLRWSGPVEADRTVLVSSGFDDRWDLTVDGDAAPQARAFGWANAFEVPAAGDAGLSYRTPILYRAALVLQALVWLAVVRTLLRARLARPPAHRGGS